MLLMLDALRRQRGALMELAGLGPRETPYRIIAEQPGMRVRAYAREAPPHAPAVLILPAPFKRSYIWDLSPEVSVVRRCLEAGLQVFLLEWRDPGPGDEFGLAQYAEAFPVSAVEAIFEVAEPSTLTVTGHSLGGAFAAIVAALHPEQIQDLWLIDAPLAFPPAAGDRLAATLRWLDLDWVAAVSAGGPVAGSFITALAAAALPDEFLFNPASDLLTSGWDTARQTLHAQVLRWTLDEFPLPMRLFREAAEQLYRHDCFRKGTLAIGPRRIGLADVRTPIAAVLNPASAVVPVASLVEGLRLTRAPSLRTLKHEPDPGCAIQHVGPLVSPSAHARIWPELVQRPWLASSGAGDAQRSRPRPSAQ